VRIRFFQRWLKKNQAEGSDEVDTPQAGEFCNVETLLRPFFNGIGLSCAAGGVMFGGCVECV
jgi:hypothetical protein